MQGPVETLHKYISECGWSKLKIAFAQGQQKRNSKQLKIKLMGEVGMAVRKSIQTRVVGIIRYNMLHPYCFSSNGNSMKSSRDVQCTLLSLLPLFVYILFCTAIPASPFNFFQSFLYFNIIGANPMHCCCRLNNIITV